MFERLKRIRELKSFYKKPCLPYMTACESGICELQVVEPAPPEPNSGPEPLQPLSVRLLSTPVRVSTRVRTEEENSNQYIRTDCSLSRNRFCCPADSQNCSAAGAALFPLTETIQGTRRHTGPACNPQMDARERQKKLTNTDGRPYVISRPDVCLGS